MKTEHIAAWGNPTVEKILTEAYPDIGKFSKTFFPDTFDLPHSSLHRKVHHLIDSPHSKVVIAAPRTLGKTSLARAVAARSILYQDAHFILYIGKSATYAEMQTENLKADLQYSPVVNEIFGHVKQKRYDGGATSDFSKKAWVAYDDIFILPRGAGQQIRGLNWRGYRPDLFIIDDLEDDEELENEEIRRKNKIWFFAQVLKAKPLPGRPFKFIWIDTLKHEDALIVHILEDSDWQGTTLSICDENYKTLAPDFMPQDELDKELAMHRRQGIMDVFAREMMSMPISKEDAVFKSKLFQYYREYDTDFRRRLHLGKIESIVIVDPAKTVKMHSAHSGIVTWGIDLEKGKMHLREARGEKLYPEQLYQDAFNTATKHGARTIAVEVTSLEEFIKHPFRDAMIRGGYNFELVWLKARKGTGEFAGLQGGKKGRISSLVSSYRSGLVFHNENNCGAYEQQLLGFPRSKRWDIMDAGAYIVELMEMGLRYFQGPEQTFEDDEKKYAELEKMHALPDFDRDYNYLELRDGRARSILRDSGPLHIRR